MCLTYVFIATVKSLLFDSLKSNSQWKKVDSSSCSHRIFLSVFFSSFPLRTKWQSAGEGLFSLFCVTQNPTNRRYLSVLMMELAGCCDTRKRLSSWALIVNLGILSPQLPQNVSL